MAFWGYMLFKARFEHRNIVPIKAWPEMSFQMQSEKKAQFIKTWS